MMIKDDFLILLIGDEQETKPIIIITGLFFLSGFISRLMEISKYTKPKYP